AKRCCSKRSATPSARRRVGDRGRRRGRGWCRANSPAAKEHVRYEAERIVHSHTIENVFSVFRRGMIGVHRHGGEFDFRYDRRAGLKIGDETPPRPIQRDAKAAAEVAAEAA